MADFLSRLAQGTLEPTPQVQPLLAPMYAPGPTSPAFEALAADKETTTTPDETPPVSHAQRYAPREAGATRFEVLRDIHASRFEPPQATGTGQPDAPSDLEAERPAPRAAPPPAPEAPVSSPGASAAVPPEHSARHETLPQRRAAREAQEFTGAPVPPGEARVAPVSAAPGERPSATPAVPKAMSPEKLPEGRPRSPSETPEPRPAEAATGEPRRQVGAVAQTVRAPHGAPEGAALRESRRGRAAVAGVVERVQAEEKPHAAFPDALVTPTEEVEAPVGAMEMSARPVVATRLAPPPERPAPHAEGTFAPVIRVTIGRVEVRAILPPAPAPLPAPVRPVPALSLDDYLKQTSGKPR